MSQNTDQWTSIYPANRNNLKSFKKLWLVGKNPDL